MKKTLFVVLAALLIVMNAAALDLVAPETGEEAAAADVAAETAAASENTVVYSFADETGATKITSVSYGGNAYASVADKDYVITKTAAANGYSIGSVTFPAAVDVTDMPYLVVCFKNVNMTDQKGPDLYYQTSSEASNTSDKHIGPEAFTVYNSTPDGKGYRYAYVNAKAASAKWTGSITKFGMIAVNGYPEGGRIHIRNIVFTDDPTAYIESVIAPDPIVLKFSDNTMSVTRRSGSNMTITHNDDGSETLSGNGDNPYITGNPVTFASPVDVTDRPYVVARFKSNNTAYKGFDFYFNRTDWTGTAEARRVNANYYTFYNGVKNAYPTVTDAEGYTWSYANAASAVSANANDPTDTTTSAYKGLIDKVNMVVIPNGTSLTLDSLVFCADPRYYIEQNFVPSASAAEAVEVDFSDTSKFVVGGWGSYSGSVTDGIAAIAHTTSAHGAGTITVKVPVDLLYTPYMVFLRKDDTDSPANYSMYVTNQYYQSISEDRKQDTVCYEGYTDAEGYSWHYSTIPFKSRPYVYGVVNDIQITGPAVGTTSTIKKMAFVADPIAYIENQINAPESLPADTAYTAKGSTNGIRFNADVSLAKKANADEYGFVVTREALLGNDILTKDSSVNKVVGTAYEKATGKDLIYAANEENVTYAAFVHGIPAGSEDEVIVTRPFLVSGGLTYYGSAMSASLAELQN